MDRSSSEPLHPKIPGYGLQIQNASRESTFGHKVQQSSGSKSRGLSPERTSGKKNAYEAELSSHRRSRSPRHNKHHKIKEQKAKMGGRSPSPKQEVYRRPQASRYV
nr:pre-mRNA-splicing factor CWC25 homolog [Zootoca vivipara]